MSIAIEILGIAMLIEASGIAFAHAFCWFDSKVSKTYWPKK